MIKNKETQENDMSTNRFSGRLNPMSGLRNFFGLAQNGRYQSQTNEEVITAEPNGKTVLLVDDDAVILKTTAMKLKGKGYRVIMAKEASAAIRAARKERPDVILMDVGFPPDVGGIGWDGFAVTTWLRRVDQTRNIPIIIMTGAQTGRCGDRAAVSGAAAFFPKPLDHQALIAMIERIAAKPSAPAAVLPGRLAE